MKDNVRDLHTKVVEVGQRLSSDTEFTCAHLNIYKRTCISQVIHVSGYEPSLDRYPHICAMCNTCQAYWLSLLLEKALRKM